MDNHLPTLVPPDTTADLQGYTPYPDAGDPLMLTADLPETIPLSPSPIPPSDEPKKVLSFPDTTNAVSPTNQPIPTSRQATNPTIKETVRAKSSSHSTKKLLSGAFSLFALLVYGVFLLWEGGSLLSEGVGKFAVEGFFGFSEQAEVVTPEQPPESTPDTTPPAIVPPNLPIQAETSPPAREEPIPSTTAIADRDLSSREPNGLGLINETPYTPDLSALAATPPVIDSYASLESIYGKDVPAVLILHTHGTEAFQNRAEEGYHTIDKHDNICAVGDALADVLTEKGIGVIHCTELFDKEAFDLAYYNAAAYIRQTLAEYPSIRYILDIHRDAITTEDGTGIRPLSVQNGVEYAQLMFVTGTDHGGSGHDTWETNLALATRLQTNLHEINPTLMRDINLRSASFNAQYAPGAMLIEAGAACSTLEEAVRSIVVFGDVLAAEILGE